MSHRCLRIGFAQVKKNMFPGSVCNFLTLVELMELICLVCLIWIDLTDWVDWIALIELTDLMPSALDLIDVF